MSRSLSACQGTLLLVDACQGIQAQTVANFYLAFSQELAVIPVINKVAVESQGARVPGRRLTALLRCLAATD